MNMKEVILREAVRQGLLSPQQLPPLKVDRNVAQGVYDFLVAQEDILAREEPEKNQ